MGIHLTKKLYPEMSDAAMKVRLSGKRACFGKIEDMRRKCIDSVSSSATPTLRESICHKKWFEDRVHIKLEYVNGFMSLCQNVGGVPQLGILLDDAEDAEELVEALQAWLATKPRSRNE